MAEPSTPEENAPETPEATETVTAEVKAEEPTAEVKAEEPTAEAKAEEPTAEVKAEEPTAEVKAEEPTAEVKAEEPKEAPKEAEAEAGKTEGVKRRRPKGTPIAEIKSGMAVKGIYVLRHFDLPLDRQGKPFLVGALADATGRVEARMWGVDPEALDGITSGAVVKVEGQSATFQSRLQVRIDKLEPVDPAEAGVDATELVGEPERSPDEMLTAVTALMNTVGHPKLKALLDRAFSDPGIVAGLRGAPAALSVHHAWRGGLLEHTLATAQLADSFCRLYPQVDRDVAITGALLHDLGKLEEFDWAGPLSYTDAGRLMGHLVLGANRVRSLIADIPDFPETLCDQLMHILVSHHGVPEHGAAKPPMTLEALVVHFADLADARISSWSELLDNAGQSGWTDYSRFYDRPLFRPDASQGKKPRKRRGGRRRRSEEVASGSGGGGRGAGDRGRGGSEGGRGGTGRRDGSAPSGNRPTRRSSETEGERGGERGGEGRRGGRGGERSGGGNRGGRGGERSGGGDRGGRGGERSGGGDRGGRGGERSGGGDRGGRGGERSGEGRRGGRGGRNERGRGGDREREPSRGPKEEKPAALTFNPFAALAAENEKAAAPESPPKAPTPETGAKSENGTGNGSGGEES